MPIFNQDTGQGAGGGGGVGGGGRPGGTTEGGGGPGLGAARNLSLSLNSGSDVFSGSVNTTNVPNSVVTWVSGSVFNSFIPGQFITINSVQYGIQSIQSATQLTLQSNAGLQNGVAYTYTAPSNSQLVITITPNDMAQFESAVSYNVYWLSPRIFSQNDIYAQTQPGVTGNGTTILQGRIYVTTMSGGSGTVSTTVPFQPYSSGGWMYATLLQPGGGKEYRLNGTNYVPVPLLPPGTGPLLSEMPQNFWMNWTTISGSLRLVQFAWVNPPTLTTVNYVKIAASNYNDKNVAPTSGRYSEFATYLLTARPGAVQGAFYPNGQISGTAQTIILNTDIGLGAHNIKWYCIPCTSSMVEMPLASVTSTVTSPSIS